METGGDFQAGSDWKGDPRFAHVPRGEVRLCGTCAVRGCRGEKLGLFEPIPPG